MQSYPIKKAFSQRTVATTSHRNKANEQLQISSAITFCELAVHLLIFEKYQSCVCTTVTLSHRFKSLPAIPGEVAAFRKTGYLMNAGHFRFKNVSTGDLNRPRSPEVRKPLACFLVLFARRKKHEKRSFRRELRGSSNLESAHTDNKLMQSN